MKKRLLALLMTILMLLSASCAALADDDMLAIDLTFLPGEKLAELPLVSELSATTALRSVFASDAFGLSLLLNNKDMLALNLGCKDGTLYLQSDAVADEALYATPEDIVELTTTLLKQMGADDASIEKIKATLPQQLGLSDEGGIDLEALEKRCTALFDVIGNDKALMALVSELSAKIVTTEGDFPSEDHDLGKTKIEASFTQEDVDKLLATDTVKEVLKLALSAQNQAATEEELGKSADELLSKLHEKLAGTTFKVGLTAIMDEESSPASLALAIYEQEAAEPSATFTINHLTRVNDHQIQFLIRDETAKTDVVMTFAGGGEDTLKATLLVTQDGKTVLTGEGSLESKDGVTRMLGDLDWEDSGAYCMKLDATLYKDAPSTLDIVLTRDDKKVSALKSTLTVEENKLTWLCSVASYRDDDCEEIILAIQSEKADDKLTIDLSATINENPTELMQGYDKPLGTVRIVIAEEPDDGRFDALRAATPENGTRVAKLTGDEMNEFVTGIQSRLIQKLFAIIGELPPSAMEAIMPLMQ